MKGYKTALKTEALENTDFRRVLYTAAHSQLVLMCLNPNEEIGMEVHPSNDQFFMIEDGSARVLIDGNEYDLAAGDVAIVPAGAEHNLMNTSGFNNLKLFTIYSPAQHKDGVVRATKDEAEKDSPEFDGKTSE